MQFDRVILGDAVEQMRQMPSEVFDAVITDPPYGVTSEEDDYVATQFIKEAFRVLKPNAAMLILVGQRTLREFWNEAELAGFEWLNTLVWWHRNSLSRQTTRFSVQYDPILYFAKGEFKHRLDQVRVPYRSAERLKYPVNNKKKTGWTPNPLGAMCPDVWEIPAITGCASNGQEPNFGHKWQKPVSLMGRMIACCTDPGGFILDPYCGSGTSLVAARDLGVHYIGIEINPEYYQLALTRLSDSPMSAMLNSEVRDIFD